MTATGPAAMRSTTCGIRGGVHALAGGQQGPGVVLLHGLDGAAAWWLDVADALAEDHRVLAVDLPGFGHTPAGRGRVSMPTHAATAIEVAERLLDGPVTLVGHSAGALVALLAAARHPGAVEAVVLLAPAVPRGGRGRLDPTFLPVLTAGLVPGMLLLEPWRRSLKPAAEQVDELLAAWCAPDSERPSPATRAAMVAAADQRRRRDHLRGWAGTTRSLFRWLARPGRFHEVADDVDAPVTLVSGVLDPALPRETVADALDHHPTWRGVSLAGVGHVPQLERPRAVVDTLRAVTRRG